jgi:micrococcal nuclease
MRMGISNRKAAAAAALGATGLLVAIATLALAGDEGAPARVDCGGLPQGEVIRVVSGDMVIVRDGGEARRLRLVGVRVPSLAEPAGRQAQRFLADLIAGEQVYIEYPSGQPERDKSLCYPAYLYRAPEGLLINLELVRDGYADVADGEFVQRPLFERYAGRARESRRGRWAAPVDVVTDSQPAAGRGEAAGEAGEQAAGGTADGDEIVYVTPSGKKYHRADCYHVRNKGTPMTLREAKARGYEPCSHCKPPQ